jgi:hypothetical protein
MQPPSSHPEMVPFGIPAELGKYLLDTFAANEESRDQFFKKTRNISIANLDVEYTIETKPLGYLQNLSFQLSTTPFVTSGGFRDLCFPNVLDNE